MITQEAGLLAAGDKYDLSDLKSVCESSLCGSVNIDTVLGLLTVADRHAASVLKTFSMRFIVEYSGEILDLDKAKDRETKYRIDITKGCYMYYFKHMGKQFW